MSNQAGARQDAAKRRREYVVGRACSLIGLKVGTNLGVTFAVAAFFMLFISLLQWIQSYAQDSRSPSRVTVILWFVATFLCAGLSYAFFRLSAVSRRRMKVLRYVPSVAEQLAALPAEAILVRGSIQPAADPNELLKAASVGIATPEELLRAEPREAK